MTSDENGGSYDYIAPSVYDLWEGHNVVDVNPWLEYGNTPQDTTTKIERVKALKDNWISDLGYKRYGNKK